jgi:hypothetical protein
MQKSSGTLLTLLSWTEFRVSQAGGRLALGAEVYLSLDPDCPMVPGPSRPTPLGSSSLVVNMSSSCEEPLIDANGPTLRVSAQIGWASGPDGIVIPV